jgi:hypothetical protein
METELTNHDRLTSKHALSYAYFEERRAEGVIDMLDHVVEVRKQIPMLDSYE